MVYYILVRVETATDNEDDNVSDSTLVSEIASNLQSLPNHYNITKGAVGAIPATRLNASQLDTVLHGSRYLTEI